MLHTPKDIADFLVHTYGASPKGVLITSEEFEQYTQRYGADHRLVRSVDLELRPMGYILFDLLQERQCVVMMSISSVIETLAQGDIQRAG
jgi:hypothetical protein